MRFPYFIFISMVLLLAISCKVENKNQPEKRFQVILPDTSMASGRNWEYKVSIGLCNQLNLNKLDNGVDSFEMRWWFPGYLSFDEIFDIRYSTNYGWIANKTIFFRGRSNYNQSSSYIIDSSFSKQIHPLKDISKIVDTIQSFDILHIPSQVNIPNFKDGIADGTYIIIELATKNFYKIISYHCPDAHKDEPNNLRIWNINKFLSTHFGGPFLNFPPFAN